MRLLIGDAGILLQNTRILFGNCYLVKNIGLKIVILGLRCYTCDTDGSGSECITNPGGLTSSACTEGKDYCFTYRREDQIEGSDPSKYPRTTLFDEKLVSFVITFMGSLSFTIFFCNDNTSK